MSQKHFPAFKAALIKLWSRNVEMTNALNREDGEYITDILHKLYDELLALDSLSGREAHNFYYFFIGERTEIDYKITNEVQDVQNKMEKWYKDDKPKKAKEEKKEENAEAKK